MQIEPIAMLAELVGNSGETEAHGLLTLSPTPGELEFKSNELSRLDPGATIGIIVNTLNGTFTSLVGKVSFYGRGIVGICNTESEGMKQLMRILSQNAAIKTYATDKVGMFKRGEEYDISITRIDDEVCNFTSIEDIAIGTRLYIDTNTPISLKKYTVIVEERLNLRNMVTLYIAKPEKISKHNQNQLLQLPKTNY